jgi:hypothetical protein
MARVRMLKPGFFENAKLAKLPPHDRLLFAGLWTIGDKRGRLKDNVKSIAGAIFPHENVNVERSLKNLAGSGFILRYEIDDEKVIQIVNFEKHQTPHYKEAESRLPPAPLPGQNLRQSLGLDPGHSPVVSRAEYGIRNTEYGSPDTGTPEAQGSPPPVEQVLAERPNIFKLYEQLFGKGVSPLIADRLREYEQSHSSECIAHCFVEAAESNARNVKLVYSILDRHATEGCYAERTNGSRNGANTSGGPAAGSYPTDGTPPPPERIYVPNPDRGRDGP